MKTKNSKLEQLKKVLDSYLSEVSFYEGKALFINDVNNILKDPKYADFEGIEGGKSNESESFIENYR